MSLSFNTAGPCVPGEHYMLPPERRFGRVLELVDEGKCFTLRAGRQTGKTTSIQWLAHHYNSGSRYAALGADLQTAREVPDVATASREVLAELERCRSRYQPSLPALDVDRLLRTPRSAVHAALCQLAAGSPRPLVLLMDEADGLVGEAMVSFLTQLRRGYVERSEVPFPHALALVGMREVRDYVISAEERRAVAWLGTTSPFNITTETVTLRMFTREEVDELLLQHTEATGQRFEPEALEHVYHLSQGHPWLANALGAQVVHRDVRDRDVAVTKAHVEAAKETLIVERRSHIDSLMARLREPRVARLLDPMLAGEPPPPDLLDDDVAYLVGLGLLVVRDGMLEPANPVYREVMPRALTYVQQIGIYQQPAWYLRPDGTLDLEKLMVGWQKFWRKDGHLAAAGFGYREAGPHLMLMAFLQRIVNSGGRVEREYGLGRGALDLVLEWQGERHAVEVKLRRGSETEHDAFEQLARYLDSLGLDEGWLVLFDLRGAAPWQERLFLRDAEHDGKRIHVVGC